MANPTTLPGDLIVPGSARITGAITPAKTRANILAQTALASFPIPLTSFRTWDDMAVVLPSAGANDDLGLVEGTFGSATPTLQADDHDSEGSAQLNYARVLVQLPWEYEAGNSVTLRFMAGMITTIADQAATLDCEVYKQQDDPDDAIGSDLCATAATTMNSLTFANIDFSITATALSAGNILDVRVTTSVDDDASGTAVIAAISWAHLLCDVR